MGVENNKMSAIRILLWSRVFRRSPMCSDRSRLRGHYEGEQVIHRFARTAVLFIVVVIAVVPLPAQTPEPFSADLKFGAPGGIAATGRLFSAGSKVRIEASSMGQQSVLINDTAHNVGYMLAPQQRAYMQVNTEGDAAGGGGSWRIYNVTNPCLSMPNTTCQKTGAETVDGRLCTKWQFNGKDAAANRTVWIDRKAGIPIKIVATSGTLELTNIKFGPQDPTLFQVPEGYQRLN